MAIPNSPQWSDRTTLNAYIQAGEARPPIDSDLIQSSAIGPVNLGDSKGKLNSRYWLVFQDYGQVLIAGSINGYWGSATALFNEAATVSEIALTFDQLGRPLVFYRINTDELKLYWYNPVISDTEIKTLAQGQNPTAGFDLPGNASSSISDAMLFYVREDKIYMRVQRDRFLVEYETPVNGVDIDAENVIIESAGARVDNRFQVAYLRGLPDGFIPPDYIPPTPQTINYRYYYRLTSAITYFYLDTPLLTNPATNNITLEFRLIESKNIKAQGLGFPIYCEGEQSIPYPITAIFNSNIGGNVQQRQLTTAKRFSLSFMYDLAKKLQLVLVINGVINVQPMPFDFSDGRWSIAIMDNTITITHENTELFTSEIVRGVNNENDVVFHAKFAAYNMQTPSENWTNNFKGIMSDINTIIDNTALFYPLNERDTPLQPSRPAGNDIVIQNHRQLNWIYKQY